MRILPRFLRVVLGYGELRPGKHSIDRKEDPGMWTKFVAWLKASWKAVAALVVPIALGALADMFTAIGEWVATTDSVWAGTLVGALSAIAVWLKRNAANP